MFNRMSPRDFVLAHFRTFYDFRTEKLCWGEILLQFVLAVGLGVVHVKYFTISSESVGVVVSAASIVAGLILNLMVLIYTLLITKVNSTRSTTSNDDTFRKLCEETLANAAFCVFACVVLVIGSICKLADKGIVADFGQFTMVFSGVFVVITLLVILKRCYSLVSYVMKVV